MAGADRTLAYKATAVNAAVSIEGKPTEYRIEGERGLVLICQPSGEAAFYYFYSVLVGKVRKLRKLRIGSRGVLTLADAAKAAHELRRKVEMGEDPVIDAKAERSATTFCELVELRLVTDTGLKDSTKRFYRETLMQPKGKSVLDMLGDLPLRTITGAMIVDVLDKVEQRSGATRADAVKRSLSSFFRYAQERQSIAINPCAGIGQRDKRKDKARDRVLTDAELAAWVRGIDECVPAALSASMRTIFKLAVLTGQRRGEVAGVRVSELQGLDTDKPIWRIKGDTVVQGRTVSVVRGRTKNGRDHAVPLSRQAAELFRDTVKGAKGDVVFPADLSKVKVGPDGKKPQHVHIAPHSVTAAARRLRDELHIEDVRTHDLRRSFATWSGDNGIRPDVIEAALSHTPQGVTKKHYMHSTLEPLVRQAMQAWADHVEAVASGQDDKQAGNIVPLRQVVAQ